MFFTNFRECNTDNFDALENQYLWLVKAKEFKEDLFDSTIYFDITKQRQRIGKIIENRLPELIIDTVKKELAKKGIHLNISDADFQKNIEQKKIFLNSKSQLKKQEIKKHLIQCGLNPHKTNQLIHTMNEIMSKESIIAKSKAFLSKLNSLNEITRESHYVSCLTLKKDNDIMWNQYALDRTGFCIAYDISRLENLGFDKYQFLYSLQPMIYKRRKQFDISKLYDFAISKYLRDKKISEEKNIVLEMNIQVRTKKPEYSYENEWRIMIEKIHMKNRKHFFPFACAIYAGLSITEQNVIKLKEIALKLNIPVYLQKLNDSKSEYVYTKC